MTDPLPGKEPVPLAPPSQPITGDSHHHLIAPLIAHAAELGYTRRDPRPPRARARRLVRPQAPPDRRRHRTRQPAGPHAHPRTRPRTRPRLRAVRARAQAEVLVDCVTYCVLRLRRPRRRRRVDPVRRRLGRRRRARRDPRIRADDRHDRPPHRRRPRPEARAGRRRRRGRSPRRVADAGSVGGCGAPMIGQARPADARRDVRRRRRPPAGLTRDGAHAAPDRHPTPQRRARRRGRALPAPPPRAPPRRRTRRRRAARAHRGRLPDRLGDPAAQPARARRDLRLAARRRHPRGLPALGHRPTRRAARAAAPRGRRLAGGHRRPALARRCGRGARGAPRLGVAARAPTHRSRAQGRGLQLRGDPRANARTHTHQRQQVAREGAGAHPADATTAGTADRECVPGAGKKGGQIRRSSLCGSDDLVGSAIGEPT